MFNCSTDKKEGQPQRRDYGARNWWISKWFLHSTLRTITRAIETERINLISSFWYGIVLSSIKHQSKTNAYIQTRTSKTRKRKIPYREIELKKKFPKQIKSISKDYLQLIVFFYHQNRCKNSLFLLLLLHQIVFI